MVDFTNKEKWNSERLSAYHSTLIQRKIESQERLQSIKSENAEHLELQNKIKQIEHILENISKELYVRFELGEESKPAEGMFSAFGYHVGETKGLKQASRQAILREIFECKKLPLVGGLSYVDEFGEAKSKKRYNKMYRCLNGFMSKAASERAFYEWKDDKEFMEDYFKKDIVDT